MTWNALQVCTVMKMGNTLIASACLCVQPSRKTHPAVGCTKKGTFLLDFPPERARSVWNTARSAWNALLGTRCSLHLRIQAVLR